MYSLIINTKKSDKEGRIGNILLNLIEDCENKVPQCWEMAEKIRELEMKWNDSCYLPVKNAVELAGYLISDYILNEEDGETYEGERNVCVLSGKQGN